MTAASAITVFWPGRAALREGPLWDPRTDTLYWVDIVAGAASFGLPALRRREARPVGVDQ